MTTADVHTPNVCFLKKKKIKKLNEGVNGGGGEHMEYFQNKD